MGILRYVRCLGLSGALHRYLHSSIQQGCSWSAIHKQPCPRDLTESRDLEQAPDMLNTYCANLPAEKLSILHSRIHEKDCSTSFLCHQTSSLRGPHSDSKLWPYTTRRLEDLYHIAPTYYKLSPSSTSHHTGQYFSSLLLYTSLPSTCCHLFCLIHHCLNHCMAFHLVVSPSTS